VAKHLFGGGRREEEGARMREWGVREGEEGEMGGRRRRRRKTGETGEEGEGDDREGYSPAANAVSSLDDCDGEALLVQPGGRDEAGDARAHHHHVHLGRGGGGGGGG
jgi:hypothetical protein